MELSPPGVSAPQNSDDRDCATYGDWVHHAAADTEERSDADRALDWYTSRLGLDTIDRDGHWITVGRKGQPGKLHLRQPGGDTPASELEPGNSGILLYLPGNGFEGACTDLMARGVTFSEGPTTADWGTYGVLRDPDGNEHALTPDP